MTKPPLNSDRPISQPKEDLLGRASYARAMAKEITGAPAGEGFVMGLLGPWGSGKSSLLNLMEKDLESSGAVVIRFNPWLFSGTEQLIRMFFKEVGSQLGLKSDKNLKKVGASFKQYGDLLAPLKYVPVVGQIAEPLRDVVKATGQILTGSEKSVLQERTEIEEALRTAGKRIVVLIDDIDRLQPQEVRDIVRLVRLTGDFPNCIYVLAFDRDRVERQLDTDPSEGRAYLEKILQVTHAVPPIREGDLTGILGREVDRVLASCATASVDETELQNIFYLCVRPLLRSLRDVRRYINALPSALEMLGDEVSPIDVMALEALRVLREDLYQALVKMMPVLTSVRDTVPDEDKYRAAVEELLQASGDDRKAVTEMIKRIFPPARRYIDNYHASAWQVAGWSTKRRVAHARVLELYFAKSLPDGVPAEAKVRLLFDSLESADGLKEQLASMNADMLYKVLERLHDYYESFTVQQARTATPILMSLWKTTPRRESGWDVNPPEVILIRVVLRILEKVESKTEAASIIGHSLGTIDNLSAKMEIVSCLDHDTAAGERLVTPEDAKTIESQLEAEVMAAKPARLSKERDLVRIVAWLAKRQPNGYAEWLERVFQHDGALGNLLQGVVSQGATLTLGDVAASKKESTLDWGWLVGLFDEQTLRTRLKELKVASAKSERGREALSLAKKYANGWRPKH